MLSYDNHYLNYKIPILRDYENIVCIYIYIDECFWSFGIKSQDIFIMKDFKNSILRLSA